jgi:hypothetical protein
MHKKKTFILSQRRRGEKKEKIIYPDLFMNFHSLHSLTPLSPSPTLRAGEGVPQSRCRERTPLPFMGEGIKG